MSETLMSEGLKKALGITESLSTEDQLRNIDDSEFAEFKEEPRPDIKFEIQMKETSVPDLVLSDAKVDYAYARSMNYQLLDMTTQALMRALEVAKETEHPRAFESFNSLATTARGLTQDLLALQKVLKEVTKGRAELEPPPITNQTNVQINGDVNSAPKGTVDILSMLQGAIDRGEIKPLTINDGGNIDDEDS